jgi:hypothetical protein
MESLYSSCVDVPPGTYLATLKQSRVVQSTRTGNVGVTLWWKIARRSGGRTVWRTLWLSPGALPRTKRELALLGVHSSQDLDKDPPVPLGARCRLVIDSRMQRDGCYETQVVRWDVVEIPMARKEHLKDE